MSDLEHLVSLADMMGGHARLHRLSRQWVCQVRTDVDGDMLASAIAPTITAAVLACLAKLRSKESDHAE